MYGLDEKVVDTIIMLGKEYKADKIVLFGSRARGDYKERSDIDIAIYGGNAELFAVEVEEKALTLLKFDVVDMNKSVQEELKKAIEKEGVVLYEKV